MAIKIVEEHIFNWKCYAYNWKNCSSSIFVIKYHFFIIFYSTYFWYVPMNLLNEWTYLSFICTMINYLINIKTSTNCKKWPINKWCWWLAHCIIKDMGSFLHPNFDQFWPLPPFHNHHCLWTAPYLFHYQFFLCVITIWRLLLKSWNEL